ncbi:MAG: hypothetical protein ACRCY4_09485 [Brevinema sp.]
MCFCSIRYATVRLNCNGTYGLILLDEDNYQPGDGLVVCVANDELTLDSFIQILSASPCKNLRNIFFRVENGTVIKNNTYIYIPKTQTLAADLNGIISCLINTASEAYRSSPYVFIPIELTCIETPNTICNFFLKSYSSVEFYIGSPEFNRHTLLLAPEKLSRRTYRYPISNPL